MLSYQPRKVYLPVYFAQKADPDYGVGINPISRLIQIQQAKKEKEPVYMLLAEKGMPRRKEFVIQVGFKYLHLFNLVIIFFHFFA